MSNQQSQLACWRRSRLLMCTGILLISLFDGRSIADELIDSTAVSVLTEPIVSAQPPMNVSSNRQQKDGQALSAAVVRSSIQRGVQFLQSKQNDDGSWVRYRSRGDVTALATLALINSDVDTRDPSIQRALNYLLSVDENLTTYFVSLRIMALVAADPRGEKYRWSVSEDVKWLLGQQVPADKGKNAGGWSYGQALTHGADASNSQFALLALHEASRMGVKTPQENWLLAKQYWLDCFNPRSGGFTYTVSDNSVRGSMTCAGISSLIIIGENLAEVDNEINGEFANCCGNQEELEPVERAVEWLGRNFTVKANPTGFRQGNRNQLYYLYGMERAGRLSGRRFFGPHDWYRDGAKELIFEKQNRLSGSWINRGGHGEDNPEVATSLALLFLSKGKRPVAIGKLKHGAGRNWDQHPKGVHYLTRRLEEEWNQKLNWQTVIAENATVDDLLEAPVLFISGRDDLDLNADQKTELRTYVENGGFIFAEACRGEGCGEGEFDRKFRELMAELFPDSELQMLDPGHPVWNAYYPLLPKNNERPLLGLQACCRTSVVYCPANLSAYWSLNRPAIKDQVSKALANRIEYCTEIGVNVVTYATGRQLKEKGETPRLVEDSTEMLTDRVLVFPKLLHEGGSDDAPNAWRNVLKEVKQLGLHIKMDKTMVAANVDQLADYPFVFFHGRSKFSFSESQRQALRAYLEFGGFIFADSICSSPQFTDSFRKEMEAILDQPLQPIQRDHEIWTNARFGYVIDQVTLRTRDANVQGGFRESRRPPELLGGEIEGRLAVVFSPYDLSCALENTTVSECDGYTRDDAVRIGTNVILYSLLSDLRN